MSDGIRPGIRKGVLIARAAIKTIVREAKRGECAGQMLEGLIGCLAGAAVSMFGREAALGMLDNVASLLRDKPEVFGPDVPRVH